ncbi:MAG TPA: flagellar biosynthetic protein FliR [Ignavibacteria bacterium]|nr:flagellar biosynthetic protein FliR [Ignavibacteria bacterium]
MTEILTSHFMIFLFIFIRVTAVFVTAPLFSNKAFPAMAKIALALVISYLIFTFIDKDSIQLEVTISFIFTNVIKEILTGVILGFSVALLFFAISFAGTIIGFDIGMAMAQVLNPTEETNNNVLGEYLYILAILILILINGHHYIIRSITYSFTIVPIGMYTLNTEVFDFIVKMGASVFVLAVKIASPILVSFFLVHLAEGIMARVIPQMQVFFVTYPLKIGIGIVMLMVTIPLYVYLIKNLLHSYEDKLYQLIQTMS